MKVVFDTNVLVSMLFFEKSLKPLKDRWQRAKLNAFATGKLAAEYADTLAYPKFKKSAEEISKVLEKFVMPKMHYTEPFTAKLPFPCDDPDDEMVLRAAMAAKVDCLITGDLDLLKLNGKYPFKILSPGDFIAQQPE